MPEWALPVLAQGETVVPFADWPENFNPNPAPDRRLFDTANHQRRDDAEGSVLHDPALRASGGRSGHLSPEGVGPGEHAAVAVARRAPQDGQHRAHRRLRMLRQPPSAAGAHRQRALDGRAAARPCSRRPASRRTPGRSCSSAPTRGRRKWSSARRSTTSSSSTAAACRATRRCRSEPFLAYALNGEPLTRHQGSPLRLLVPGWYGAPNVKWLAEIHAQEDQYLGKFQARWYRTLKGEMINGEMKWMETAITHLQLSRSSRA